MRLIDADKLHEEIYELTKFRQDPVTKDWYSPRMIRISEVLRHIDFQPSIEAIEVGKVYTREEFEKYGLSEWKDKYGQRWVMVERRNK